jgi:4-hydroxy-tetrahydrodipicolinate reductase
MKIGILGAGGRLGSEFLALTQVAASPKRGEPLDPLSLVDVVLDVSSPTACVELMERLTQLKKFPRLVIGSTGWSDSQIEVRDRYAQHASVLVSANFSAAVNLLSNAISKIGPIMDRLGYTIEITETHHVHKKDSPSGTALLLAGSCGVRRDKIKIDSTREGEVVGMHRVTFRSPADTIVLEHEAHSRSLFAKGALLACEWSVKHAPRPGVYSMSDALGL